MYLQCSRFQSPAYLFTITSEDKRKYKLQILYSQFQISLLILMQNQMHAPQYSHIQSGQAVSSNQCCQVFTAVIVQLMYWFVTLCSLVDRSTCYSVQCCLHV